MNEPIIAKNFVRGLAQLARHEPLPCLEDRRKIIAQANLVLAEARATADRLDQGIAFGWSGQTAVPVPCGS